MAVFRVCLPASQPLTLSSVTGSDCRSEAHIVAGKLFLLHVGPKQKVFAFCRVVAGDAGIEFAANDLRLITRAVIVSKLPVTMFRVVTRFAFDHDCYGGWFDGC